MSRKPLTIDSGQIQQLPDGASLDVGGWDLPANLGSAYQVMIVDASGTSLSFEDRLTGDTNWWISPTGNDSTGDGSEGDPWATFGKIITEVGNRLWESTAILTVNLEDGDYTISSTVTIPKMTPVLKVTGRTPYSFTMSATVSQSNVSGDIYDVRITLDSVTNLSAGMYVLIETCTALETINGCWEIQSVDSETDITIRIVHLLATPPIGAYAATVYVPRARLHRSGGTLFLYACKSFYVSQCVLIGTTGSGIQSLENAVYTYIGNYVGISGFGYGVYGDSGCDFYVKYCAVSRCIQGLYFIGQTNCSFMYSAASGNSSKGIAVDRGASDYIHSSHFCSNAIGVDGNKICVIIVYSSFFDNNTYGIHIEKMSYAQVSADTVFTGNTHDYSPTPLGTPGNHYALITN